MVGLWSAGLSNTFVKELPLLAYKSNILYFKIIVVTVVTVYIVVTVVTVVTAVTVVKVVKVVTVVSVVTVVTVGMKNLVLMIKFCDQIIF